MQLTHNDVKMDSLYTPNVVDLDTSKCVLLPSHDEESNHCCDDQDTIESNSNVGHGHSRRKKRRRKKRRGEMQLTHNDVKMDSLYTPNVVDLDTSKCVLLPSHDEESNHCCDDQDTIESNSNVGHGHSRRKKRRRKKRRGEMQLTHNDGDRQSHHPPAWCHVYKSTNPSSIRTQACSIAYIEASKSSIRNRNRRANTKLRKQQRILVEVIVPTNIKQNLLSELDTDNDIVVVDGGDVGNPPISPPDDVKWHCLSIHEGNHLHVQDETNPHLGLTSIRVGGCLPFIRMPRQQSLDLIRNVGMSDIVAALEACEELKPTPLKRGGGKQVFGDYGKRVQYTSAGVQVSRNSCEVLKYNTYLENLPVCHRLILMKLVRRCKFAI